MTNEDITTTDILPDSALKYFTVMCHRWYEVPPDEIARLMHVDELRARLPKEVTDVGLQVASVGPTSTHLVLLYTLKGKRYGLDGTWGGSTIRTTLNEVREIGGSIEYSALRHSSEPSEGNLE